MRSTVAFFIALTGCSSSVLGVNKHGPDTGAGSSADSDADSDADADGGSEPDVHPDITFAQAACERGATDEWFFNAAADDPQGIETLAANGEIRVLNPSMEAADPAILVLDCSASSGFCTAEYSAADVGAVCALAEEVEFEFTVSDEDGNQSDAFVVSGSAS